MMDHALRAIDAGESPDPILERGLPRDRGFSFEDPWFRRARRVARQAFGKDYGRKASRSSYLVENRYTGGV